MKQFCQRCERYLEYQDHEVLSAGSVGIHFRCPGCGVEISLITNPGETMLVHSLGVKLGGTKEPQKPLSLTRETLQSSTEEGLKKPQWSEKALERLNRIPPFARPMARKAIETFAKDQGHGKIDEAVLDAYRKGRS